MFCRIRIDDAVSNQSRRLLGVGRCASRAVRLKVLGSGL